MTTSRELRELLKRDVASGHVKDDTFNRLMDELDRVVADLDALDATEQEIVERKICTERDMRRINDIVAERDEARQRLTAWQTRDQSFTGKLIQERDEARAALDAMEAWLSHLASPSLSRTRFISSLDALVELRRLREAQTFAPPPAPPEQETK